jgi:hypothetical protein
LNICVNSMAAAHSSAAPPHFIHKMKKRLRGESRSLGQFSIFRYVIEG